MLGSEPLFVDDAPADDAPHPDRPTSTASGAAWAFVPLQVAGSTSGVLALLWDRPRGFDDDVRAVVSGLAAYCALAVQRALLLEERVEVAVALQRAMLPELPEVGGARLAALYRPAARRNEVGGDWVDAIVHPDGSLDVVVGDVVGHDIAAAAAMGRIRHLTGALTWDRPQSSPAEIVRRLDRACRDLGVARMASLVHGRLAPPSGRPGRAWVWTNAGHPPPVVVPPDGPARFLAGEHPELLVGVVPDADRSDWSVDLAPGSVLVLYSDGLVESRERRLSAGLAELLEAVERHRGVQDPDELAEALAADLLGGGASDDDVAILVVALDPAAE